MVLTASAIAASRMNACTLSPWICTARRSTDSSVSVNLISPVIRFPLLSDRYRLRSDPSVPRCGVPPVPRNLGRPYQAPGSFPASHTQIPRAVRAAARRVPRQRPTAVSRTHAVISSRVSSGRLYQTAITATPPSAAAPAGRRADQPHPRPRPPA